MHAPRSESNVESDTHPHPEDPSPRLETGLIPSHALFSEAGLGDSGQAHDQPFNLALN